jgi:acetyl/propionyl-CoA carboxylase alpha subunit
MKLQAETSDEKHEIEIKHADGKVFASVDGREYELEVSQPEPNVYLLKNEGKIFEAFVSPQQKAGDPFQVQIGRHSLKIKLFDPKRLRGSGRDAELGDGAADRILVEKGAAIEKGDGVLVVEAMKMQNELKSPKAGTVKDIRVEEGSTVAAGDVLAIIE